MKGLAIGVVTVAKAEDATALGGRWIGVIPMGGTAAHDAKFGKFREGLLGGQVVGDREITLERLQDQPVGVLDFVRRQAADQVDIEAGAPKQRHHGIGLFLLVGSRDMCGLAEDHIETNGHRFW